MSPINRQRTGQPSEPKTPKPSSGSNKGILWIVVVIAILGLGAAGYFFGYPEFQKYWDARYAIAIPESPPADTTTIVVPPVVEEIVVLPEPPAIPTGYYIIVGSFRKKDNADRLVQKMSGSDVKALFFEELGLYRVSVGYTDNARKAFSDIQGIRASYGIDDAWVLHKR